MKNRLGIFFLACHLFCVGAGAIGSCLVEMGKSGLLELEVKSSSWVLQSPLGKALSNHTLYRYRFIQLINTHDWLLQTADPFFAVLASGLGQAKFSSEDSRKHFEFRKNLIDVALQWTSSQFEASLAWTQIRSLLSELVGSFPKVSRSAANDETVLPNFEKEFLSRMELSDWLEIHRVRKAVKPEPFTPMTQLARQSKRRIPISSLSTQELKRLFRTDPTQAKHVHAHFFGFLKEMAARFQRDYRGELHRINGQGRSVHSFVQSKMSKWAKESGLSPRFAKLVAVYMTVFYDGIDKPEYSGEWVRGELISQVISEFLRLRRQYFVDLRAQRGQSPPHLVRSPRSVETEDKIPFLASNSASTHSSNLSPMRSKRRRKKARARNEWDSGHSMPVLLAVFSPAGDAEGGIFDEVMAAHTHDEQYGRLISALARLRKILQADEFRHLKRVTVELLDKLIAGGDPRNVSPHLHRTHSTGALYQFAPFGPAKTIRLWLSIGGGGKVRIRGMDSNVKSGKGTSQNETIQRLGKGT